MQYGLFKKVKYAIPVDKINSVFIKQTLIARFNNKYCIDIVNIGMDDESREEDMHTTDVKVVPSLLDKVGKDYSWCATFQLVWNNMMNEAEEYGGRVHLGERDTFKAPHINFNVKREYKEFENKQ